MNTGLLTSLIATPSDSSEITGGENPAGQVTGDLGSGGFAEMLQADTEAALLGANLLNTDQQAEAAPAQVIPQDLLQSLAQTNQQTNVIDQKSAMPRAGTIDAKLPEMVVQPMPEGFSQVRHETISPAMVEQGPLEEIFAKIKSLLVGDQKVTDISPVIALLSGQLGDIPPQAVPVLVSESPLIQEALSASDAKTFLETPLSVGKIVQTLGFGERELARLASAGIELDTAVTPSQLLNSLGVDVGRIGTELDLLKANLQLEGVRGYMERAERQAKSQAPIAAADQPTQAAPVLSKQTQQPGSFNSVDAAALAAALNQPTRKAAANPAAEFGLENRPSDYRSLAVESEALLQQSLADKSSMPSDMTRKSSLQTVPAMSQVPLVDASKKSALTTDLVTGNTSEMSIDNVVTTRQPLGEKMTKVDPLTTNASHVSNNQLQQNKSQMVAAPKLDVNVAEVSTNQMERLAFENRLQPILRKNLSTDTSQIVAKEPQLADIGTLDSARPVETLDASAVKQPQAVAKHLSERIDQFAKNLLHQAGGSMKFDLKTADSKYEIALDVTKDKVDLQIITGNKNVSEILGAELPRLRDALAAHDLELKEFDVSYDADLAGGQEQSGQSAFEDAAENASHNEFQKIDQGRVVAGVKEGIRRASRPLASNGRINVLA